MGHLELGPPLGVHQRLVLRFVVGIAIKETPPGQLRDLFAHQALFVETVAEPLLHAGGVHAELAEQIVGAEPGAVAGKARVGFDQVGGGGIGAGLEQSVVGQGDGRGAADCRSRAGGSKDSARCQPGRCGPRLACPCRVSGRFRLRPTGSHDGG